MMPRAISFPAGDGVNFNDITPRMSATYDLRGNGKTALKFATGKYMQLIAVGPGGGGAYEMSPLGRLNFQTTRNWNDLTYPVGDPRRGNFVPDCDLANPAGNNGECGALANQNFGLGAPFSTTFDDPNIYSGWGNRPYQWEVSAAVQQELMARVSLHVGWYRRTFGNSTVTDNLATGPGDFGQFKVTAPTDPRLADNSGQTYTYLNVNDNKFGQTNNRLRFADDFGGQPRSWNGVDININVRPRNGLTLQGGFSTGNTLTDSCAVAQQLPEILGATAVENCKDATGYRTEAKFLTLYMIPKIDVQVGSTYQSIPGATLAATFNAPNALVAPSLGRPLSGQAANMAVNLQAPGTVFGDRINQLDFRVAKRLRFGATRMLVGVDLYNSLNINTIQRYITTYGPNYLDPSLIMPPRFLKFSAQVDF